MAGTAHLDFRIATPADDADIRRLLRDNPMEGAIRLGFEREPDSFLAAGIHGDVHQQAIVRARSDGAVMGMGARSLLEAWVNGEPARLGYLSQLRADRAFRGSPRALLRSYECMRELHGDGATPFYVSTIVEDNLPARRILEAGIGSLPRYRAAGRLVTFVLPVRRARRMQPNGWALEPGRADTMEDASACLERHGRRHQFAPRWTRETLASPRRCRGLTPGDFVLARRGGHVAGCAAVWDQRAFKQTVVRGYGPALRLVRPFLNAAPGWWGGVPLPAVGEPMRAAFLSHVAIDEDDPALMAAIVAQALEQAAARGLSHLVTGFSERHPLAAALAKAFPARRYKSILYVVHWDDGTAAVEALDGRVPHPEVAIL